jgi:hypothetical protein
MRTEAPPARQAAAAQPLPPVRDALSQPPEAPRLTILRVDRRQSDGTRRPSHMDSSTDRKSLTELPRADQLSLSWRCRSL